MDLANDKFDPRRFGLITGSACSVLFPEKGDGKVGMASYAKKLANEKFFKYYDEVSTWQMQHGSLAEHEAFEYFKANYFFALEKGRFEMIDECAGTSDALATDYGIDFKCPTSLEKWLDYIHVGIDKSQFHQAQMYMYLFKKNVWKIAAYLTETDWMTQRDLQYPVPMDKRMIVIDVAKQSDWEARLLAATPLVIQQRDRLFDLLTTQFTPKK